MGTYTTIKNYKQWTNILVNSHGTPTAKKMWMC